jgi:predicted MFS family arabinose efflux permease
MEAIRADLSLSYAEAGLVLTALPAGGLLGHGFTAAADYVERRWLATFGALAYGLCLLAFAAANSLPALLAASFIWGATDDAFIGGCEVTLVDLYRDELAPVLARVNAYGAVGDLLGPLTLAAAAALGVGWRGVFVASGALMVGYAAFLAAQRFPSPRPREGESVVASLAAVARDRRLILLAVVTGLFSTLAEPFLGFTSAYLERVRGLSPAAATTIAAVVTAAGIVGFLTVPLFTRRLPTRPLLLGFGALVAASVMLLIAAPSVPLQVVAGFAFGWSGATFYSVLQATYLSLRPGQAGASKAVVSTIGLFGLGLPPLVGAVSDGLGLAAGLAVYAAVALVMLALVAAIRAR